MSTLILINDPFLNPQRSSQSSPITPKWYPEYLKRKLIGDAEINGFGLQVMHNGTLEYTTENPLDLRFYGSISLVNLYNLTGGPTDAQLTIYINNIKGATKKFHSIGRTLTDKSQIIWSTDEFAAINNVTSIKFDINVIMGIIVAESLTSDIRSPLTDIYDPLNIYQFIHNNGNLYYSNWRPIGFNRILERTGQCNIKIVNGCDIVILNGPNSTGTASITYSSTNGVDVGHLYSVKINNIRMHSEEGEPKIFASADIYWTFNGNKSRTKSFLSDLQSDGSIIWYHYELPIVNVGLVTRLTLTISLNSLVRIGFISFSNITSTLT